MMTTAQCSTFSRAVTDSGSTFRLDAPYDLTAKASHCASNGSTPPHREVEVTHTQTIRMELAEWEINLLIEALDSHEYRQLSEWNERNDGYSTVGDCDNEEIDAVRELIAKLERSRASAVH